MVSTNFGNVHWPCNGSSTTIAWPGPKALTASSGSQILFPITAPLSP